MTASLEIPGHAAPSPGDLAVVSVPRRWSEAGREFVQWQQETRNQYQGRSGKEAARFYARVGQWLVEEGLTASPSNLSEAHVVRLLPRFGSAPKTKRVYLSLLSTLCEHHGNNVVRRSGVARSFPKVSTHRRWLTPTELDRLCDSAVGIERVVLALEAKQGLRRVELTRMRISDLDLERGWLVARGKAARGGASRRIPVGDALRAELRWWLPRREALASGAIDCPELLAWNDSGRMRPYSYGSIDRFVRAAGRRAGVVVSNHDLRRTFGRILRNRGADWREIAGLYGHASTAISEYYVGQEDDRLVETMRLLDRPVEGVP